MPISVLDKITVNMEEERNCGVESCQNIAVKAAIFVIYPVSNTEFTAPQIHVIRFFGCPNHASDSVLGIIYEPIKKKISEDYRSIGRYVNWSKSFLFWAPIVIEPNS